jgi:hypothetical protein
MVCLMDTDTKYFWINLSMMGNGLTAILMVKESSRMQKLEKLLEPFIKMVKKKKF